MSEKKKKKLTLQDPGFIESYLERFPNLTPLINNGKLTLSVGTELPDGTTKMHDVVSNAMPEIVFSKSGPGAIKSLKVTLGSYEEDSTQLLHYMHKKTEN